MGEVYRARDTKLGRDVAIKILPRLSRPTRMLAALNHPNVGAIYGVEESEGIPALVLELVEGRQPGQSPGNGPDPTYRVTWDPVLANHSDDLPQRIAHGVSPLDEARQIARARSRGRPIALQRLRRAKRGKAPRQRWHS
jgi:serine/threonine protein kinase